MTLNPQRCVTEPRQPYLHTLNTCQAIAGLFVSVMAKQQVIFR